MCSGVNKKIPFGTAVVRVVILVEIMDVVEVIGASTRTIISLWMVPSRLVAVQL